VFGYFLLGLALLVVLLMVARALVNVPPRQLLVTGKWVGLGALGGLTLFLAVTGRLSWALTAAAAFLPWIVRLVERNRMRRSAGGWPGRASGAGGGASEVETATLHMRLDHATGDLDGQILTGQFAGRWLSDLALNELALLLESCRHNDPPSVSLLETYLDRHHAGWRAASSSQSQADAAGSEGKQRATAPPAMTREEALRVLGLGPDASEAEIRAAHRRLIAGLHPDRGGSSFLAALINRARDVLISKTPR
jgi:hypothetical protein